ncbi:hypothetical protein AMJ86_08075 [bacterium SM23_57]|nr:MAG: hypothetical protein AMJ86_08075 [bacterium SM23_57]
MKAALPLFLRGFCCFPIFLVLVLPTTYALHRYHEPNIDGGEIAVTTTSPERGITRMQFTNPRISREQVTVAGEQFTDVWVEGGSHTTQTGLPSLPVVNMVIGIPDHGNIQLRILHTEYTEESGHRVYPFQGLEVESEPPSDEFQWNQDFYRRNTWFPSEVASISEPAVMRDVRIMTVTIHPVQYNPATNTIRIYHNIDVQVEPAPGPGTNEKTRFYCRPSSVFMPMYRQLSNFDYLGLDDEEPALPGTYLAICGDHPTIIGYVEELVNWKRRKGVDARLVTTSETGTGYTQIHNYIVDAYNTWDPQLEYVCLVGDVLSDPNNDYNIPCATYGGVNTDNQYALVEGSDQLPDIAVGRLSADGHTIMELLVMKTVRYEQNPFVGINWYDKGYLLAGTTNNVATTMTTMEHIRQQMYDEGFTEVVLHTHGSSVNQTLLHQQLSQGRSFFFHRPSWTGQIGPAHANGFANGWMLPYMYTITCGTNVYAYNLGTAEAFLRFGSIYNGGGVICCSGSSTSGTHTRFNNMLAAGISDYFMMYHGQVTGISLMEGKFQVYRNYYAQESGTVNSYYMNNFNLMGDPEVHIWTAFPESLYVSHASEIALGMNRVPVAVTDDQGDPVEGALVCLMKGDETWTRGLTDESGYIEMPTEPETTGDLWITVGKKNHFFYQADIAVNEQNLCLSFSEADIDDSNVGGTVGNGDGVLNPGEIVDMTITAKNFGTTQTATNVVGTLSSYNTSIARVVIDQQSFPNIAPGLQVQSQGGFRVEILEGVQNQVLTPLLLELACNEGTDTSLVRLDIVSGDASLQRFRFLLTDNRLDPGETEQLMVEIRNIGNHDITQLEGNLFTEDSILILSQPHAVFGNIAVDTVGDNSGCPFIVAADLITIPGFNASLGIALSGGDGFMDTVYVEFPIGVPEISDPTGPDEYGYWCYDNLDTLYELCPQFDWIEIDPNQGGSGDTLPIYDNGEDLDDNVMISLPFVFRFYGMDYDSITVCSNGWAAFGAQDHIIDYINYMIPGPIGPDAMLAVFWDDLVVGQQGHVVSEYVESEGLFILEWSDMRTRYNSFPETFQIILYDPSEHPTQSGDGLVKYQYLEIHNESGASTDNNYATVGIEDHTQTDGIQLTCWNNYPWSVAPLDINRAYLFVPSGVGEASPDSTGPHIAHAPLSNTTDPAGPYWVYATIWDLSDVDHADLHRSINGISFVTDPMANPGGDQWVGSIPGQSPGTFIHYFISAEDTLGNYAQTDTFTFGIWETVMSESFESGAAGWSHYNGSGGWADQWHLSEEDAYNGSFSWKCGDADTSTYADSMHAFLESPVIELTPEAELHFYHRIQSEISNSQPDSAYDGGLSI